MNISAEMLNTLAFETGGEAYFGYSGRGMFGAECVGITLPNLTDLINLGCAIKEAFDLKLIDRLMYEEFTTGASTDNMGRDYIIYWPNINCTDAPADEEDEDE